MNKIRFKLLLYGSLKQSSILTILLQSSGVAFSIQILGTILKYFMQVFLARWMGTSEYGIFFYAYNWGFLLTVVAGFGFTSSAIRFVPEYIATRKWDLLRGYIARSSQIVIIGGVILTLIGASITFRATVAVARLTLLLGLSIAPLMGFAILQSQFFRGMKNMILAFTPTRIIQPIFVILLSFLLFRVIGRVSSVITLVVIIVSLIFVIVIQSFYVVRSIPIAAKTVQLKFETKTWITVSMPMMVTAIAYSVINQIDIAIVGVYLDPKMVGIYAAATKTASLVSFLLASINAIVAPLISELISIKDTKRLNLLVRTATYWMIFPTLGVAIFLFLLGRHILGLFGSDFVLGYWPLMILVIGQLINAITGPVGYITELSGHESYSAKVFIISALVSIVLSILLIPSFGILGASIATSLAIIMSNIWLHRYVYSNILINAF